MVIPFYAVEGQVKDERGEPAPAGWYVHTPGDFGIPSGPYDTEAEAALDAARQE